MPYTWTGPISPDSPITAEQSTNIGRAIEDAWTSGADSAPADTAGPSTFNEWLKQNETAVIAAAFALAVLALVASSRP
jgi:hypothetical protein